MLTKHFIIRGSPLLQCLQKKKVSREIHTNLLALTKVLFRKLILFFGGLRKKFQEEFQGCGRGGIMQTFFNKGNIPIMQPRLCFVLLLPTCHPFYLSCRKFEFEKRVLLLRDRHHIRHSRNTPELP